MDIGLSYGYLMVYPLDIYRGLDVQCIFGCFIDIQWILCAVWVCFKSIFIKYILEFEVLEIAH